MTFFARRTDDMHPFKAVEVLERARALERQGRHVVHFEVGESDFPSVPPIIEAGTRVLREGHVRYTQALGMPELRRAIADRYTGIHPGSYLGSSPGQGLDIDPERIAVTTGASGGLAILAQVLINPGDEILMTDPGYPCNATFVKSAGGEPRTVPVGPDSGFQMTAQHLEDAWGPRTKGVLLASPSNPMGSLLSREELRGMIEWCKERDAFVIVDEIYQGLVYDETGNELMATSSLHLSDDVFVVNSFSKYFGMTGWRIGWLVLPVDAITRTERMAQHLYISPPELAQHAALRALTPEAIAMHEERRQAFRNRRDLLLRGLEEIGFDIASRPMGAFYIYAGIEGFSRDTGERWHAEDLCRHLIEEHGVALTPGTDFGEHRADAHVRFAFTTSESEIALGLERLARALR